MEEYINSFNLLEDETLNCHYLSNLFYTYLTNQSKAIMTPDEMLYFKEYQNRVFNLVEDLREKSPDYISQVLIFLNKGEILLGYCLLLVWSLPRAGYYVGKELYNEQYKENIDKYNSKISEIIENPLVAKFSGDILGNGNKFAIHCIDYVWYYMDNLPIEFFFTNYESGNHIRIVHDHHDEYIQIGINMEYMLSLGLGKIYYQKKNKPSFRSMIKFMFTDEDAINQLLDSPTAKNYKKQLDRIREKLSEYFE